MSSRTRLAALAIPLLALSACFNNGIEWSKLSFTRSSPHRADLIGVWRPTKDTLDDMRLGGHYALSRHELVLREDGSFSMLNMPDWWSDGFGRSKRGFESGSGHWKLAQDQAPYTVWLVDLNFPSYVTSVHIARQSPPYLLYFYIGDPDSGHHMLFERVLTETEASRAAAPNPGVQRTRFARR